MKLRCETGYLQIVDILFQHVVFHFPNGPALHANQVQVRFCQCPQFVLNRLGVELMPHDQAAVFQHIQRVVKRCPTHMEVRLFQLFLKGVHIEMTGEATDAFKDRISFLRLS